MEETPLPPETLAKLDDGERFDWLRFLRCENIGPRTFQVLLRRHGSAGAALAALPVLIASGKAGRPIRIRDRRGHRAGDRGGAAVGRAFYWRRRAGLSGASAGHRLGPALFPASGDRKSRSSAPATHRRPGSPSPRSLRAELPAPGMSSFPASRAGSTRGRIRRRSRPGRSRSSRAVWGISTQPNMKPCLSGSSNRRCDQRNAFRLGGVKLDGRIEWHGGDLVWSLPASWPRANDHEE
jgi:DprA/Smf-like nucleotide binding protein involved in DNA uptake